MTTMSLSSGGAAVVLLLVAATPGMTQTISGVPLPAAAETSLDLVVDHVEAPAEIALGTMAVNLWATLRQPDGVAPVAGATLVFPEVAGGKPRTIALQAVDGAFDSPVEEAVATVDTYAWVKDGAHEWELHSSEGGGSPQVLQRGAIRVKGRVSTPDLVLFDDRGGAHPWIGSGAGGFAPGAMVECGLPAFPPALVDLNGDRLEDLVTPTDFGKILTWKNRGGGRLEIGPTLELGPDLVSGAIGDVTGDGKPDLVTVTSARTLEIRSEWAEVADFSAELTLVPERVAIADVDGDGVPDICLALLGLQQGEVQVWQRNPDGGWAPRYRLQPPQGGRGRIVQLAGSPHRPGLLILSELPGEGVLESWEPPADTNHERVPVCRERYRVPGEPVQVVAGRFAVGVSWVTVVREGPGSVLYGVRDGAGLQRLGFVSEVPRGIEVLDLDGDGDDDLVTGGVDLRLWINIRGIGFREAGESPYLLDHPVVALLAGNLDERGS